MKRMKGSGKHLSRNNLEAPNEIKTWKSLGLIRRAKGVMILIGESESMSSQDAVVTPTNRCPGAYAVFLGRSMQNRQDDAGTTTATVDPTTVVNEEFAPIAAEVAEDTHLDISSHIRRVLAEDAVPARSVAALKQRIWGLARLERSYRGRVIETLTKTHSCHLMSYSSGCGRNSFRSSADAD